MNFSSVDVIWTLLGAALVYFMQAGFAMCEAGLTRAKNPSYSYEEYDGFLYRNSRILAGRIRSDVRRKRCFYRKTRSADPRKLSVWISADLVFRHFPDGFLCNICHDRFRFHGRANQFQSLLFI